MIKDKEIIFKGNKYIITDYEIDNDDIESSIFYIENDNDKKSISLIAFIKGIATTKDEYINSLIAQQDEEESKPKEQVPQKSEKEQAIEDAQEHFFAKPQYKDLFKKLEKELHTTTFSEYEETYYNEFKRLKNSARKNRERRAEQTIDNTYKGDIDELIDWLKDAIKSIDIESGDSTLDSAKEIASEFNKDYEVRVNPSKYAMQFIARLTDKEEILNKMPQEVRTWKAHKNIGKLKQFSDEHVYNEKENILSSNDIVFDLLNAYNFKLGRQEN